MGGDRTTVWRVRWAPPEFVPSIWVGYGASARYLRFVSGQTLSFSEGPAYRYLVRFKELRVGGHSRIRTYDFHRVNLPKTNTMNDVTGHLEAYLGIFGALLQN